MRPSGVYLSTASGRLLDSLETISSRDKPVCLGKSSNTSDPIACSNCDGEIGLFGPRLTHESATSSWPCCLKALTSSRSPSLNNAPTLVPLRRAPPSFREGLRRPRFEVPASGHQDCAALRRSTPRFYPYFDDLPWPGAPRVLSWTDSHYS